MVCELLAVRGRGAGTCCPCPASCSAGIDAWLPAALTSEPDRAGAGASSSGAAPYSSRAAQASSSPWGKDCIPRGGGGGHFYCPLFLRVLDHRPPNSNIINTKLSTKVIQGLRHSFLYKECHVYTKIEGIQT